MSLDHDLPLVLLPESLAVCRLPADSEFPEWASANHLMAFVRTQDELSVVCAEKLVPPEVKAERGWRAFQVQGPLDFSMIGVLASITEPLARVGVSVFALSTYDTDYILIKEDSVPRAQTALEGAGFLVLNYVSLSS